MQEMEIGKPGPASSAAGSKEEEALKGAYMLPLRVVLEVPVVGFTVRSLLDLQPGSIVETAAQHNEDLEVHANGQRLAMAKFDVTGDLLAVRVTEVA